MSGKKKDNNPALSQQPADGAETDADVTAQADMSGHHHIAPERDVERHQPDRLIALRTLSVDVDDLRYDIFFGPDSKTFQQG